MKKQFHPIAAFFIIALTALACSSSFDVVETQPPTAVQVNTPTEALPNDSSDLLPQPLYYLDKDSQGLMQVFRMERDGKTTTQLTFEPVTVTDYDVYPVDGSIAYVANNQILQIYADGSNRHVLVDGGSNPVFSPTEKILAYRLNGLNLLDLSTGDSNLALQDQPLGGSFPPVIYFPDKFSPDGTKLLIKVGHPPDSPWTAGIYSLAINSLTPITGDDPSLSCCTMYGGAEWSTDSSSLYAVATTPDSSTSFGALWKIDATTGAVTTLIPGSAGDGNMLLFYQTYKPHSTTTGQLYFFSAKYPEATGVIRRAPLLLIRSLPNDIINNWTVMRGDTFEMMNEALWSPDAGFVVVVFAPSEDVYDGGRAEIVYLDGRPNVALAPFVQQMKWGP